jgi:tetratricopeptide (TPR) repeat protein
MLGTTRRPGNYGGLRLRAIRDAPPIWGPRPFASCFKGCVAIALWFMCAPLLQAQTGGHYTISGMVRLPDGNPAVRAKVSISGQTGFSRQATTDDSGRYEFTEVPRGRYSLAAVNPSVPEQYSERVEIEVTRLSANMVAQDIYLRSGARVEPGTAKKSAVVSVAEETQRIPKAALKEYERAAKLGGEQKFEKALQSFNRSIELFPGYFQAITERGRLLVSMGQFAEARKDFTLALAINPRYEPSLRGMGICEIREGEFAGAVQALEQAVSLEPRDAAAYLFLGFADTMLDRRVEARAALEKALNIDPAASARAHVHLATLALKENRIREAIQQLEAYLATVPNAPDAQRLRSVLAQLKVQARLGG